MRDEAEFLTNALEALYGPSVPATLIKHDSEMGEVSKNVPLGQIYKVYPTLTKTVGWKNKTTGVEGKTEMIMTASRGDSVGGWFPLECLKLENN